MVTSPRERFRAFVMRHVKSLGCDVYEGAPTGSPYPINSKSFNAALFNPYVIINHAGVKDGQMERIPGLSSYDDALDLLKFQVSKYVQGVAVAKRIIIRTPPEIVYEKPTDPVTFKPYGEKKYFTYFRLLADDGVNELAKPNRLLPVYCGCKKGD